GGGGSFLGSANAPAPTLTAVGDVGAVTAAVWPGRVGETARAAALVAAEAVAVVGGGDTGRAAAAAAVVLAASVPVPAGGGVGATLTDTAVAVAVVLVSAASISGGLSGLRWPHRRQN